jgi:RNA polymerase sigma-70 factor (ECF subfamily)
MHRYRGRGKRGEGQYHLTLDQVALLVPSEPGEMIALDDALTRLAEVDARKAQVVELRYFGGLNVEEAAQVLRVSPNTVIRAWAFAKAWLRRELEVHSGNAD